MESQSFTTRQKWIIAGLLFLLGVFIVYQLRKCTSYDKAKTTTELKVNASQIKENGAKTDSVVSNAKAVSKQRVQSAEKLHRENVNLPNQIAVRDSSLEILFNFRP